MNPVPQNKNKINLEIERRTKNNKGEPRRTKKLEETGRNRRKKT